jgi:hypothetical protein
MESWIEILNPSQQLFLILGNFVPYPKSILTGSGRFLASVAFTLDPDFSL